MSRAFCVFLADLLAPWGEVVAKPMFGGFGIYREGRMFGIVAEETLYLKTGESNRREFEAAGSEPLTYTAKGRQIALSYWRVPSEMVDEPEMLIVWAEKAYREARQPRPKRKRAEGT